MTARPARSTGRKQVRSHNYKENDDSQLQEEDEDDHTDGQEAPPPVR